MLEAAHSAGELALSYFRKLTAGQISSKSNAADLVSIADQECELLIEQHLAACEPAYGFIGEESWRQQLSAHEYKWVVDPIDGTSNYLAGLPLWAISIALCDAALQPVAGVIHAPSLGCTWSVRRGHGAFRNGELISVRRETPAGGQYNSMLATGFPYDTTERGTNLDYFSRMQSRFHKIRRMGSAAIDLAFIAEGIFDGMWELKLKPWDTAAGILLVTEAGGSYSQIDGAAYTPGDEELVVAARPELLALICAVLGGIIN
jgi:myo-inositol-1(or 4)-monophosphatase